MPNRQTHTYIDRILFGKSYWKLHQMIDSAYFVVGRWHRKYHHDFVNAVNIALNIYPNDPVACDAAFIHIMLDNWCSCNPYIKKIFEDAAKKYYKKMQKSKEENKFDKEIKLSPELEVLVRDLKKTLEAKRLHARFYGIR